MDLKERIDNIFLQFSEEEKKTIEKGTVNSRELTSEEVKILKNLVIKNLSFESLKSESIKESTKVYVSFISFAKTEEWELSPVQKSLQFLKNLNLCYLLATPETENDAKKQKELLLKKNPKLEIKIVVILADEYEQMYSSLEKDVLGDALSKNNYNLNNIVIDNTLGHKMISAVLYKFSVEQGVKLITWQNEHFRDSNGFIKRIPASDKLSFLEYPQLKNFAVISKINSLIKNHKFDEAKDICETINNIERAEILRGLSKVFNMETMLNSGDFLDALDWFLEEKFILNSKTSLNTLKKIQTILEKIDYIEKNKSDEIFSSIHALLAYNFFKEFLKHNSSENSVFYSFIKERYKDMLEIDSKGFKDFSLDADDFREIITEEFTSEMYHEIDSILFNFSEVIEELLITLPKQISSKDGILEIKKYDLKIELKDEFQKFLRKDSSINSVVLSILVNSFNYKITLKEIDNLKDGKFTARNFDSLKKYLGELNELIAEKLSQKKIIVNEEFIKLEKNEKKLTFSYFNELEISHNYIY